VCDADDGCSNDARTGTCDDGIACTSNDRCTSGQCTGVPNCETGAVCNADTGLCETAPEHGCSVNFWKEDIDAWDRTTIDPHDSFDGRFNVEAFQPDITMFEALDLANAPGGSNAGANATDHALVAPPVARQAVAALLNARHPDLNFPLSKDDVKDVVRDVVEGDLDVEGALAELAAANALGCPLGDDVLKGDANRDGLVTAVDALMTLRTAVGSDTCPLEICDVDSSGAITAPDALLILRVAVGASQF
jgi:hypothetical protein